MQPDCIEDSHKSVVCVIDGNSRHQTLIKEALDPFYQILPFANSDEALDWLREHNPSIVIMDEDTQPLSGISLLEAYFRIPFYRRGPNFMRPPILCTSGQKRSAFLKHAHTRGAESILMKPFKRSQVICSISELINRRIEKKWDDLPISPRMALRSTLHLLNQISDGIGGSDPLPETDIAKACKAIAATVKEGHVGALDRALKGHNNYILSHSLRVSAYLTLFGGAIGLEGEALTALTAGGLLHDIGKLEIPFLVLNKPGELSYDEMQMMKSHVARTLRLVSSTPSLPRGVQDVIAHHHEKLDGNGYPQGLAGDDIHKLARLTFIVDVFCAMTDSRPYKPPLAQEAAFLAMGRMKGELDSALLEIFQRVIRQQPASS